MQYIILADTKEMRNLYLDSRNYKFIDLFAGLGGFHLALEALGHDCVFSSELKEDLRILYSQNFPKTPITAILHS